MISLKKGQVNKFKTAFGNVLLSGNFILGKEVSGFERNFSKYLGVKYCIGVGNGLEAIQIALMASGIGKSDQVITTPISAFATTLAIIAVGAKPIFIDTDENGQINLSLIKKAITKKTKAILPVHLYGNSSDINKLEKICRENNLVLIEDAAQAHGSTFQGKKLGTFGKLGCFSFYPTKNLGAFGDGGAIVTNSKRLANLCFQIRDYGQKGKNKHFIFGLNSRLDEIHAAILTIKLSNLDKENKKRQDLAKRYVKNLSFLKDIKIVKPEENIQSNFHQFVIRVKKRNKLIKYLKRSGIQVLIHYPKVIPDQPFLKKDYQKTSLPTARAFAKTCLSLPLFPNLSFKDIDFVSGQIINFFKK